MTLRSSRNCAWLAFGTLLAAGPVAAEEPTAAAQNAVVAPAPPAPADGGTGFATADTVPDGDKPDHSRQAVDRMREILSRMLKYLEEAREEKDVIKLNCVNEKLTAVKGLLKISEQADVGLQEAVARRDVEASAHEFEKVSIAQRKSEQLLAESEACVGELAVYSGDTEVEVVIENAAKSDPTRDTGEGSMILNRPPPASPYQ